MKIRIRLLGGTLSVVTRRKLNADERWQIKGVRRLGPLYICWSRRTPEQSNIRPASALKEPQPPRKRRRPAPR